MKIEVKSQNDEVTNEVSTVALDAAKSADGLPSRILIAPWGEVQSRVGSFVMDEEAARLTLAAFEAHGTDVPIDYEHQSLGGAYSSPSGQAPAAGWIKKLAAATPNSTNGATGSAPGLWAEVEWTPQAAEQLRDRQYRYLSPVALVRRLDRRMVGLHSVALTNKPAIVGMQAVVNGNDPTDDVLPLRQLLTLDDAVADDEVMRVAAARIRTLQTLLDARRATDRVAAAMSAGKLTAAQREWAYSLALRDPHEFDEWMANAAVVVATGRTNGPSADVRAPRADAISRRARTDYRAGGPLLAALCSEEAFVQDSLRESGLNGTK